MAASLTLAVKQRYFLGWRVLVLRRDGTTVYRIDAEGLAQRVGVTTGIAVGELIEVDGIASGDRVVIRGGERLRPGQNVTIIETRVTP